MKMVIVPKITIFKTGLLALILSLLLVATESAAPIFTTPGSPGRTVPVSETLPAGTSVYQTVAIDADGDILVYSITAQVPPIPLKFSIHSRTGLITNMETFDVDGKDAIKQYQITIRVTDGTSNVQTTLVMEIIDENDNTPVFSHYQVIRQKTKPGFVVADVRAVDIDSGKNGLVTYKITGGNEGTAFGIDSNQGVLYTMYELDYSSRDIYYLVIEARDSGATPRSSSVTMTLTLASYQGNGGSSIFSRLSAIILILYCLLR